MKTYVRWAMALLLLHAGPALAQTGSISGTVSLAGPAPAAKMLTVTKNQEVCGATVRSRELVVTAGKVAFAVASV